MSLICESAKKFAPACLAAIAFWLSLNCAQAGKSFSLLYAFCQDQGCSDGAVPQAALLADSVGNLYGTTSQGGGGVGTICGAGCGTVFKIAPNGTETVQYSFCAQANCADGADPNSALIQDKDGNFYGTTWMGGYYLGAGTVFKLASNGTETILYLFGREYNGADGQHPGGVFMDGKGDFYGITYSGGSQGAGTVFKLAPDGHETQLYSFCAKKSCSDGAYPDGGLIGDGKGNLYGTTESGGALGNRDNCSAEAGCGTVFELAANGTETVLYSFCAQRKCTDGSSPAFVSGLVRDRAGNLYGTTSAGGSATGLCGYGCGTVFELSPNGAETVLYSFCTRYNGSNCLDGSQPVAGVLDVGNEKAFYGTTYEGGAKGDGTVFSLAGGSETVLYSFSNKPPNQPYAGVILRNGYLYGTTAYGGNNNGDAGGVFRLHR